jgi:DNA-binding MarR family transcriptional regulator
LVAYLALKSLADEHGVFVGYANDIARRARVTPNQIGVALRNLERYGMIVRENHLSVGSRFMVIDPPWSRVDR